MLVTNPLTPGALTKDQVDTVSNGWWMLLVTGVLSAAAGAIILFTDWSIGDLAVFVGALLVLRGILTMFSVPIDGALRGWAVALGLLEALVGLAVWVWPGPTLLVVAFWIGFYVLFSGITTIVGSISARDVLPYWGIVLAFGIFEGAFAIWLLGRPVLTLVAAIVAIGLWSIVYGVVQIVLAFEVKNMPQRLSGAAREFGAVEPPRSLGTAVGD